MHLLKDKEVFIMKINNRGYLVYSQELLKRFQKAYFERFNKRLSMEEANAELNSLARLVEGILPEPEKIIADLKERNSYGINIS